MGDRALVLFCEPDTLRFSPVTYLHWSGANIGPLLHRLFGVMEGRRGDLSYVSARFVGICHEHVEGNLSLGMWNAPTAAELYEVTQPDWAEGREVFTYSHGDAGVFIVDCSTFNVVQFGGYGFGGRTRESGIIQIPWEKVPEKTLC